MTWPIEYGLHDWPEDAPHENGNYNNVCVHCNHVFVGHKRRVCCKACDRPVSLEELNTALKKAMVDEMDGHLSKPAFTNRSKEKAQWKRERNSRR